MVELTERDDFADKRAWRAIATIDAVVILGSGLSTAFETQELEMIANEPTTGVGVAGHPRRLAIWRRGSLRVLVALGRRHLYEGASVREVTDVVTRAASRGARAIVVTNAAGALNPRLDVGDIMQITGTSGVLLAPVMPLLHVGLDRAVGESIESGRGVTPADLEIARARRDRDVAQRALARGLALKHGVYAAVTGPSYETRAEIRMLRRMGADAVGMSTVPELIAARRHGMRTAAFSLITNTLSDTARVALDHSDVVDAGARANVSMRIAIEAALDALFASTEPSATKD